MSENNKKWKSRLLSSSIPLEYETAKILSNLGFSVSYDHTFLRKEGSEFKEFSIDLKGLLFFPLDNPNQIDANLRFLVECKYRDEGKKWLFLPDTNTEDFSNQTLGYTIRVIDEFTKRKIKKNHIYKFEEKLNFALKGVEVNITNGEVFDKDIRHGLYQLKFSLPEMVLDSIESNIYGHINDSDPWFIVPILLTNADLHLLNKDFSMQSLANTDDIESISEKVPYLICYSDFGPDFTNHHKSIFKDFWSSNQDNENINLFEEAQLKFKDKKFGLYNSPIRECQDLQESYRSKLVSYYTHFIICSFANFEQLTRNILKTIEKTLK